jgi:nicotinate-nucleotide adenylyltransferase
MGHVSALRSAIAQLSPDRVIVIPASDPPHKQLSEGSPSPRERMALAEAAFADIPKVEVSDMEITRGGKSYTAETLDALKAENPGAEFYLLVGTDMLLTIEQWYQFEHILSGCTLAVAVRHSEDEEIARAHCVMLEDKYGADSVYINHKPIDVSSTELRAMLPLRLGREYIPDGAYSEIIKYRFYRAQPELLWLREKSEVYLKAKRVPHVRGCAAEANKLAQRWGEDPELCEEAGILHDITKKLLLNEQLLLCEKYGIINDTVEMQSEKLLHSKTGAAFSRDLFGVCDKVYEGIRWHTTAKPDMTLFEKIIYLADYIEPNRDFEGVDELRALAYEDIDKAMILGLEMSLEDLKQRGAEPHRNSAGALEWLLEHQSR